MAKVDRVEGQEDVFDVELESGELNDLEQAMIDEVDEHRRNFRLRLRVPRWLAERMGLELPEEEPPAEGGEQPPEGGPGEPGPQ